MESRWRVGGRALTYANQLQGGIHDFVKKKKKKKKKKGGGGVR